MRIYFNVQAKFSQPNRKSWFYMLKHVFLSNIEQKKVNCVHQIQRHILWARARVLTVKMASVWHGKNPL